MKFLPPSFTWKKCQPPLPTGGVVSVWTENREIFNFSAYKRKIHPNRTPSHLTTEDKISIWPKITERIFCLVSISAQSIGYFRSNRSRRCFPSSHWPIWTGIGVLAENFEHFSVPTIHWRRYDQVVRFSGNFYPSAYKLKMRIIPEKQKIPMPFLAQRCRSGHKKSPQEIPVVVIIPWLFCCPF